MLRPGARTGQDLDDRPQGLIDLAHKVIRLELLVSVPADDPAG